jgi:histidine triad (HIT) family protein
MADQNCLFCKIVEGGIPAEVIYQDDQSVAFRDINPQAPVHVLIVPRKHVASLSKMTRDDETTVGHLFHVAGEIARQEGVADSGFRTVINTGEGAGQSVFHVHVHLLGGRGLHWPPG